MDLLKRFAKGFARGVGDALASKPVGKTRPYILAIEIPVQSPSKRILEDAFKAAAARAEGAAPTLLTVLGIDSRISLDGSVKMTVRSR